MSTAELAAENVKLVPYVLGTMNLRGVQASDRDDLLGQGMVALMKVAKNWDPGRGRFATVAYIYIRNAMVDELRAQQRRRCG